MPDGNAVLSMPLAGNRHITMRGGPLGHLDLCGGATHVRHLWNAAEWRWWTAAELGVNAGWLHCAFFGSQPKGRRGRCHRGTLSAV